MTKPEKNAIASALPAPLLNAAHQRSALFIDKLRRAMRAIEQDIEAHDGLYPFNKGRLTQAEVCRRAGVSNVTLQGRLHKLTTKVEVDVWIQRASRGIAKGKKNVRKAITERAEVWKSNLQSIAQAYHEDHLQLLSLRQQLTQVTAERDALLKKLASPVPLSIRG